MRRLLFLISIIASAYPAQAQDFALQFGAVFEPSGTPRGSGEMSIILGSGPVRSYTTVNARPMTDGRIVYAFRQGIERDILKTKWVDFVICGQAGVAASPENVSGIFSGCAGAHVKALPRRMREAGLILVVQGEGQNAPIQGGTWDPRVSVGFRWQPQ